MQLALKCADVGHLVLPPRLHKAWVDRLQYEYFMQGDKEREAGLPVSALMDREKASKLSSSQVRQKLSAQQWSCCWIAYVRYAGLAAVCDR